MQDFKEFRMPYQVSTSAFAAAKAFKQVASNFGSDFADTSKDTNISLPISDSSELWLGYYILFVTCRHN